MILADTSGLLALYNGREPAHEAVARAVEESDEPLVVSPYVLAELDHLVATRMGVHAELAVLREVAGGAYLNPSLTDDDVGMCAELIERYLFFVSVVPKHLAAPYIASAREAA